MPVTSRQTTNAAQQTAVMYICFMTYILGNLDPILSVFNRPSSWYER